MAINFLNNPKVGDNVKIEIGASSDLQIYHDGSNSYITNATGEIFIKGADDLSIQDTDGTNRAIFQANAQKLYYDGSLKFETTSSGISVSGDVSSGDITIAVDDTPTLNFKKASSADVLGIINVTTDAGSGGKMVFQTKRNGNTPLDALTIDDGQNATFAGNIVFGDNHFIGNGSGDNLSIQSSTGEAIVIDASSDIVLDAGGADIKLQVNGTEYAKFDNASSNLNITSSIQDKDIKFHGNDGGSAITALTLDMSDGGAAEFGARLYIPEYIAHVGDSNSLFGFSGNDTFIVNTSGTTALTINSSQNAIFEGSVAINTEVQFGRELLVKGEIAALAQDSGNNQLLLSASSTQTNISATYGGTGSYAPMQFETGGAVRVHLTASGNLGIGTTSPTKKLTISDNSAQVLLIDTSSSNTLEVEVGDEIASFKLDKDGAAENSKFVWSIDDASRMELSIAEGDESQLKLNNYGSGNITGTAAYTLQVDSSGNVIEGSPSSGGTVTGSGAATRVAFWSGTSALSSDSSLYWDNTNNRLGIGITTPSDRLTVDGGNIRILAGNKLILNRANNGTNSEIYTDTTGKIILNSVNSEGIGVQNAGSTVLTVTSAGRVGIGTTAPVVPLHIVGTAINNPSNGSGGYEVMQVFDDTSFATGVGGGIGFGGNFTSSNSTIFSEIRGLKENSTSGNYAGALSFSTRVNGANITERMRIDSSGNVGIGSTSPTSRLSLSGSQAALDLTRGTAGDSKWGLSSDSTALYISELSTGSTDYIMTFKETSGNVGIGTTSPSSELEVAGTIKSAFAAQRYAAFESNSSGGVVKGIGGNGFLVRSYGDSYFNGGDFGIGDTSPDKKLHVHSGATSDIVKFENNNGSMVFGQTTALTSLDLASSNAYRIRQGSSIPFKIETTGNATFAGNVSADEFDLPSGGMLDWANGDARIVEGLVNNYSLSFQTYNGSSLTTALRLDGNNTATFAGDVTIQDATPVIIIKDSNATTPSNTIAYVSMQESDGTEVAFMGMGSGSNSHLYLAGGSGTDVMIRTNATTAMFIDTSQRVGVGTTSPTSKLHVSDSIGGASIKVAGAVTDTSAYYYGFMHDASNLQGTTQVNTFYSGGAIKANTTITDYAGIRIDTPSVSATSAVVTNNYGVYQSSSLQKNYFAGNVGIGTTAPGQKLVASTSNESLFDVLGVYNAVTSTSALNKGAAIRIGQTTDGTYSTKIATIFEGNNPNYLQPALAFFTMNNSHLKGSEVERMRISAPGNVGIGTTAPSAKLHVSGNTKLTSGTFQVSSDSTVSSSFTYTFRDAVGINNPNSISAQAVAGFVMSVGRSISDGVGGGIYVQGESTFVRGITALTNSTFGESVTIGSSGAGSDRILNILTGGSKSIVKLMEAGTVYGFSTLYDGGTNKFHINRHSNSAAGTSVLSFNRDDDNATFAGTVLSAGFLVGQTSQYSPTGGGGTLATFTGAGSNRQDIVVSNQTNNAAAAASLVLATHGHDFIIKGTSSSGGSILSLGFNTTPFLSLTSSNATFAGNIIFDGSSLISSNTADGSDNAQVVITGGGASGDSRGASVHMAGNEHANGGLLQLRAGSGATSEIRSYTNGTERMRIDNSSTVKITSDGTNVAGTVLELHFPNNNTNDRCALINFSNNTGSYATIEGGTSGANNSGYILFKTDNAGTSSERMRIDNAGNVGIGTTSPANKLNVVEGTSNWEVAEFQSSSTTGAGITLIPANINSLQWSIIGQGTSGGAGDNNLGFHLTGVGSSGGSAGYKMTIEASSGNVGIGSTAPAEKLDVAGNIHLSANQSYISFNTSGSSGHPKIRIESDGDFSFLNTAGASTMRIENGGNVGIGTTSPAHKLSVNGTFKYGSGLEQSGAVSSGEPANPPEFTPEAWLDIKVNGSDYLIPLFEKSS